MNDACRIVEVTNWSFSKIKDPRLWKVILG